MTGIERAVDELGRIVLPAEYRTKVGIKAGSKLTVCEEDGVLTIRPSSRICKICGSKEDVHNEIPLCAKCLKKAKTL